MYVLGSCGVRIAFMAVPFLTGGPQGLGPQRLLCVCVPPLPGLVPLPLPRTAELTTPLRVTFWVRGRIKVRVRVGIGVRWG